MFVARISTGRTVREFILAAMLAPSAIFIWWMTTFGETAMDQYFLQGFAGVADTVQNFQPELSLFVFLTEFPLSGLTSVVGIILVLIFFVTSMDSGSLIVDTMTAGGKIETPHTQRVFWCVFLGLLGTALLLGVDCHPSRPWPLRPPFPSC